jgi:hypothetical protein
MEQKSPDDRVKRRLYSLYPEHILKLEKLARARKMPQSQYLRELIDVAFASTFEPEPKVKKTVQYGAD